MIACQTVNTRRERIGLPLVRVKIHVFSAGRCQERGVLQQALDPLAKLLAFRHSLSSIMGQHNCRAVYPWCHDDIEKIQIAANPQAACSTASFAFTSLEKAGEG